MTIDEREDNEETCEHGPEFWIWNSIFGWKEGYCTVCGAVEEHEI